MSLNIKNETVHALVREAARKTGQSQTSVVETALRKYLDDLGRERDYERGEEILARMQRAWRESTEPPFVAEDLYDPETGLPA